MGVRTKPANNNLQMGFTLAREGERDVTAHANADWKRAAYNAGVAAANLNVTLTTDEIWSQLTDTDGREWHPNNDSRAMSGIVSQLQRDGIIRSTGQRVPSKRTSSHSAWHTEYVSLVYKGRQSA